MGRYILTGFGDVAVELPTSVPASGPIVATSVTPVQAATSLPSVVTGGDASILSDAKKKQLNDAANAAGSSSTFTTVAIVGGVLAAGWFLFMKKDKSTAPKTGA